VQGEEGEGQAVMSGPKEAGVEAGLEASMAHVRQDAASGWSLGPDMTCLACLR
jgi:ethanolamine utilization microcompartment shell protein EutL